MNPTQELTQVDGQFGISVSNTDLFAVVGAYAGNAAHVYRILNDAWTYVQKITEENGQPSLGLGFSVAIQNHDIVLASYLVCERSC